MQGIQAILLSTICKQVVDKLITEAQVEFIRIAQVGTVLVGADQERGSSRRSSLGRNSSESIDLAKSCSARNRSAL
jgi:hypothetical protein